MAAPADIDYYAVLELPRTATAADIKRAYRRLALKYHPDKNPEGIEHFKQLGVAYEILSDPEKRQRYDTFGHAGLRDTPQNANMSHAQNLFRQFFGEDPFSDFDGFGGYGCPEAPSAGARPAGMANGGMGPGSFDPFMMGSPFGMHGAGPANGHRANGHPQAPNGHAAQPNGHAASGHNGFPADGFGSNGHPLDPFDTMVNSMFGGSMFGGGMFGGGMFGSSMVGGGGMFGSSMHHDPFAPFNSMFDRMAAMPGFPADGSAAAGGFYSSSSQTMMGNGMMESVTTERRVSNGVQTTVTRTTRNGVTSETVEERDLASGTVRKLTVDGQPQPLGLENPTNPADHALQ